MYGLLACAYARVAVLIQHASRHNIAITSLSGSSIFFDVSHKRYDFRKNITENEMCILLSVMLIDATFGAWLCMVLKLGRFGQ
jgi:hypothetical protein